jgi:phage terminase large subunit-like protein
MIEKLRALRKHHLKVFHNTTFYPYQELISDKILEALMQNLRLTTGATEEDIKRLINIEVPVEISRQAGKTTAIVLTIEFVMIYFPKMFKLERRLEIGIFAPQVEQAKTDFDRLKEALLRSGEMFEAYEGNDYKEQNNSKTLVMPNGATCYIAPVSPTSLPESKTLALMIFEESQDLNDKIVKEQIWPMGANTNAPRIYIGTAGTRICYFRKLGRRYGCYQDLLRRNCQATSQGL